ncbi:TetR/AcrR family transcriptional regulator [uncultured Pseudacidovorax sp.]|uniref:TetR/AcrR family transcriptional regulator n=1 Tax=uncultured Pseudacidovorax sp. TaxID=679313 RepID=UPI0025DA5AAF|nr:TetR/AcrR family transcriptional regulator [uncultured Pseudacidovorax sp.]
MPDLSPTRQQIVDAADALFYSQGFTHTSFAHVAQAVGISRGNFYHHFKSKDEILDAVIAQRLAGTEALLAAWSAAGEAPAGRLRCFVHMLLANQAPIMAHGCPVGSLCAELGKLDHPALGAARDVFALFRDWLANEFARAGLGDEAPGLAMHLLARSQGVAVLAQAFRNPAFIAAEVLLLESWLAEVLAPAARRPSRRAAA